MITRVRLAALAAGVALSIATVLTVSAHDVRPFPNATAPKVVVALGWLREPAYVDVDNAVQVIVKDSGGIPITAITDRDLTVDVSIGKQTTGPQPLTPSVDPDTGLGTPGEYLYHVTPTAPGVYRFHLHGTVAGTAIDETASSSDQTFAEVQTAANAQFPNHVPALSDLATKVNATNARVAAAQQAAQTAQNGADNARNLATAGLLLALLTIAGPFAVRLVPKRRKA